MTQQIIKNYGTNELCEESPFFFLQLLSWSAFELRRPAQHTLCLSEKLFHELLFALRPAEEFIVWSVKL